MIRHARLASWSAGIVCLGALSCASGNAGYLDKSVNHATEQEIQKRFGNPQMTSALGKGGTEWTYRYRSSQVGPFGGVDSGGAACREFVLTFDETHILRKWKRQMC